MLSTHLGHGHDAIQYVGQTVSILLSNFVAKCVEQVIDNLPVVLLSLGGPDYSPSHCRTCCFITSFDTTSPDTTSPRSACASDV